MGHERHIKGPGKSHNQEARILAQVNIFKFTINVCTKYLSAAPLCQTVTWIKDKFF